MVGGENSLYCFVDGNGNLCREPGHDLNKCIVAKMLPQSGLQEAMRISHFFGCSAACHSSIQVVLISSLFCAIIC